MTAAARLQANSFAGVTYRLGPVEGSPWMILRIQGDGLELWCTVCRGSVSARASYLEAHPGAIERAVEHHQRCGEGRSE